MLSGEVADAATLDKAVTIARQFGPEIINTVSVMSPQQVMLEVRFIEISRTAGRELGVQWNRFGSSTITNIGNRVSSNNLPLDGGHDCRRNCGGRDLRRFAVRVSGRPHRGKRSDDRRDDQRARREGHRP